MNKKISTSIDLRQESFWCGNCYQPSSTQLYFLTSNKSLQMKNKNNPHRSTNNLNNYSLKKSLRKNLKNASKSPITLDRNNVEKQYYNDEPPRQLYKKRDNKYIPNLLSTNSLKGQHEGAIVLNSELRIPQEPILNIKSLPKIKFINHPIHNQYSPKKNGQVFYSPIKIRYISQQKNQLYNKSALSSQRLYKQPKIISVLNEYRQQELKIPIKISEPHIKNQQQQLQRQKISLLKEPPTLRISVFDPKQIKMQKDHQSRNQNRNQNDKCQIKSQIFQSSNIDKNINDKQYGKCHVAQSLNVQRKLLTKIDDVDQHQSIKDPLQKQDDLKQSFVVDRLQNMINKGIQTMNSQAKTMQQTAPSSSIKLIKNSPFNSALSHPRNTPSKLNDRFLSIKTQISQIKKFNQ